MAPTIKTSDLEDGEVTPRALVLVATPVRSPTRRRRSSPECPRAPRKGDRRRECLKLCTEEKEDFRDLKSVVRRLDFDEVALENVRLTKPTSKAETSRLQSLGLDAGDVLSVDTETPAPAPLETPLDLPRTEWRSQVCPQAPTRTRIGRSGSSSPSGLRTPANPWPAASFDTLSTPDRSASPGITLAPGSEFDTDLPAGEEAQTKEALHIDLDLMQPMMTETSARPPVGTPDRKDAPVRRILSEAFNGGSTPCPWSPVAFMHFETPEVSMQRLTKDTPSPLTIGRRRLVSRFAMPPNADKDESADGSDSRRRLCL